MRLKGLWCVPLCLAAFMAAGLAGCSGSNFESSGDPYAGFGNAKDEEAAVEADLAEQQEAFNPN